MTLFMSRIEVKHREGANFQIFPTAERGADLVDASHNTAPEPMLCFCCHNDCSHELVRNGEAQHFTCLESKANIDSERLVRSSRPSPSDYDGPLATPVNLSNDESDTSISSTKNSSSSSHDGVCLPEASFEMTAESPIVATDLPKCVYFHLESDSVPRFPFTFHTDQPPGSEVAILTVKVLDIIRQMGCKLYLCSLISTQFGPDFAVKVNAHVVAVPPRHMDFAERNFVPLGTTNELLYVDSFGGMFPFELKCSSKTGFLVRWLTGNGW